VSTRVGAEGNVGRDARTTLRKKLQAMLVERWPERVSMETVIDDAGLDSAKFIVDASRAEDRWHQTIKRLEFDYKLAELIEAVQGEIGEPDDDLGELLRLEKERLKEATLELQSKALDSFNRLVDKLSFTTEYIARLREPENLDLITLAAIKDKLHDFYAQLDELRKAQLAAPRRNAEIAQAGNMELQANKCADALQLYMKLVEYDNSADDYPQAGVTGGPGSLSHRETDEVVLVRAKAGLRNALIRLGKAGGII
jgi:tetratricopeptide (TPR) repeat protein